MYPEENRHCLVWQLVRDASAVSLDKAELIPSVRGGDISTIGSREAAVTGVEEATSSRKEDSSECRRSMSPA